MSFFVNVGFILQSQNSKRIENQDAIIAEIKNKKQNLKNLIEAYNLFLRETKGSSLYIVNKSMFMFIA